MPARAPSPVTPSVLSWALKEDGASDAEMALRAKASADQVRRWRQGIDSPSRGELTRLAAALHRPRALFFLAEPPAQADLPTRFRHAPGGSRRVSPVARQAIRRARRVQDAVAWSRRDDGEQPIDVPQENAETDPAISAAKIRKWLNLSLDEQRKWPDDRAAFWAWREAIERAGLLVFRLSVSGDDIRGFSAWDDQAPMLAVNTARSWTERMRIFTLGHELGHLVRRTDAACFDVLDPHGHDPAVERWCEQFAAAVLLPEAEVRRQFQLRGSAPTIETVRAIADGLRVSLRAVALRLVDLGLAGAELYTAVDMLATPKRRSGGGGGDPRALIRLRQYGQPTADALLRATRDGHLTELEVTDVLRITVPDLRQLVELTQRPAPSE